jgi:hypothetical protein
MAGIHRWLVRPAVQRAILVAIGVVAVWWLQTAVERATGSLQTSVATIVDQRPLAPPTWLEGGGEMDIMVVCGFSDDASAIYAGAFLGSALLSFSMAVARRRRAATHRERRLLL